MSTPKRSRVSKRHQSLAQIRQLPKRFMAWLLRLVFISARFTRANQAGFVLPTTVLLLLVFSLTVGGLSFRSFSRIEQTISQREQKLVGEFATPAIDRAKAKIEYMFKEASATAEKRLPTDIELLEELLRRSGDEDPGDVARNPYTLADETQLNIVDGPLFIDRNHAVPAASVTRDADLDPAWSFTIGEGDDEQTVIYSISLKGASDESEANGARDDAFTVDSDIDVASPVTAEKSEAMVVRNAPISTTGLGANCPIGSVSESGWQEIGAAQLEKNFQVNVLSIKYGKNNQPIVNAAEYQQVRVAPKGLKWGAWFRYDLDIFPGPNLRWNGAMHTEGNLFVERSFKAYLTSALSSCINDPLASEISLNAVDNTGDDDFDDPEDFVGQVTGASIIQNTFSLRGGAAGTDDGVTFHLYNGAPIPAEISFNNKGNATNTGNDSTVALPTQTPSAIAIDPVAILTEDAYRHLEDGVYTDPNWVTSALKKPDGNSDSGRVELEQLTDNRPFLDDGFRADNRYGPKPVYDSRQSLVLKDGADLAQKRVGEEIVDHLALVSSDTEAGEFGLDGYWERRSKLTGMRAIVGQRLELGNANEWQGNTDPLYPSDENAEPTANSGGQEYKGEAETLQHRTLRDNLAAVQSLVVYHYTQGMDNNRPGDLPYICMASTAHPGTASTLVNSRTFGTYPSGNPQVDFLSGNGTNGWEFDFYGASFASDILPAAPLGQALRNLAHLAGDPFGGAPSFAATQGIEGNLYNGINADTAELVHPYPYLSMWGDFSILRRVLFDYTPATGVETDKITTVNAYNALSPADKSALHTAACSLGMLAYNLKENTAEASQILRDRRYGFRDTPAADVDPLLGGLVTPKYPVLYYLFPEFDHNHLGDDEAATGGFDHEQALSTGEEYFTEDGVATPYISGPDGVNRDPAVGTLYSIVDPDAIDLTPRADVAVFRQPTATPAGATLLADNSQLSRENRTKSYIINPAGAVQELSLLDKVMMDGRELMAVRTLDVDIEKLTANTVEATGESWIPESDGLIYVFREDAVREDSIVRPRHALATWNDGGANDCSVFDNLAGLTVAANANCRMDIDATDGSGAETFDPPLSTNEGISPKPVDMAPDPMRRPYGFRIINGDELVRSDSFESSGMTFVSDNPVYIKGNLNLHKAPGDPVDINSFLEEFQGASFLGTAFADAANEDGANGAKDLFYNRAEADLDPRFADPVEDTWRPVEVFADAISILSDTFLDGEVEDAFMILSRGANGVNVGAPDSNTSFLNFHHPCPNTARNTPACQGRNIAAADNDQAAAKWRRENNAYDDARLPILINRNGTVNNNGGGGDQEFPRQFAGNNQYVWRGINKYDETRYVDMMTADNGQPDPVDANRVNALLISGVHPSRPGQTYGGLHNFPRMLEYWEDKPLFISGGMFQLNFSTQATGTFDQDAWEPGSVPDLTNQDNKYYFPPNRYWGYDVALQYRFAAPIGQRFQSVGEPRNEYYRDLPLNDEYIKRLMCGSNAAGDYIEVNKQLGATDVASCKTAVDAL
ncbi:MAG: hormogonium polysaccharide biosynthesis protein HpsA [Cyanobacteria bacterium J06656_5]